MQRTLLLALLLCTLAPLAFAAPLNAINTLSVAQEGDTNIILTLSCALDTVQGVPQLADINLYDFQGNYIATTVDSTICTTTEKTLTLQPLTPLVSKNQYYVTVTLPNTCTVCTRQAFFSFAKEEPVTIPDNSPLLVGVIGVIALVLLTRRESI